MLSRIFVDNYANFGNRFLYRRDSIAILDEDEKRRLKRRFLRWRGTVQPPSPREVASPLCGEDGRSRLSTVRQSRTPTHLPSLFQKRKLFRKNLPRKRKFLLHSYFPCSIISKADFEIGKHTERLACRTVSRARGIAAVTTLEEQP